MARAAPGDDQCPRRSSPAGSSRLLIVLLAALLAVPLSVTGIGGATVAPVAAAGPCDAPANEIVTENCRPGNPASEWDVSRAGDATIQGFATDISVDRGGTVEFKIDTSRTTYDSTSTGLGTTVGTGRAGRDG